MAIPPDVTVLEYYNQQINFLVKLRDQYLVYSEDWDTLPIGVKNAVKSRVDAVIAGVKTGLDDVNAAAQDRP